MRKLKLQVQISVDGYVGGPNGELDWAMHNWDDELKKYVTGITEPVDTIVLGRKLAQGFIPHWASHPQEEGADKFNTTNKVVFTKTLERSEWAHTVLAQGELVEEIMILKNQAGQDIIAYGGATFISALIKHDLIDEYHLFINPVVIGSGLAIFTGLEQKRNLNLVKTTVCECGIVVQHYEPKRE